MAIAISPKKQYRQGPDGRIFQAKGSYKDDTLERPSMVTEGVILSGTHTEPIKAYIYCAYL